MGTHWFKLLDKRRGALVSSHVIDDGVQQLVLFGAEILNDSLGRHGLELSVDDFLGESTGFSTRPGRALSEPRAGSAAGR